MSNATTKSVHLNLSPKASLVLNIIRQSSPISRGGIAGLTGLSPARLTDIIAELLEQGVVEEVGAGVSSGGRRPILLRINRSAGFVVGVDIGSVNLRVGVVDPAGRILSLDRDSSEAELGSDKVFEKVVKKIRRVVSASGVDKGEIRGIGVGISAVINPKTGVCLFCRNMPGWEGLPVRSMFKEELGWEVAIDDSMRTMALAEKRFGKAKELKQVVHICLGNGIGAGIFIEGKMYRGGWGGAGELGHMTVNEDGPLCSCGNRGCLETLVSGRAIVNRAVEYLKRGVTSSMSDAVAGDLEKITPEIVAQSARKGDKLAGNIMNETGEHLGIGIANLANLFNPELVVIGGGLAGASDLLMDSVRRAVKARGLQATTDALRIEVSELGEEAGVLGAAALMLDEIFGPSGSATDAELRL